MIRAQERLPYDMKLLAMYVNWRLQCIGVIERPDREVLLALAERLQDELQR